MRRIIQGDLCLEKAYKAIFDEIREHFSVKQHFLYETTLYVRNKFKYLEGGSNAARPKKMLLQSA